MTKNFYDALYGAPRDSMPETQRNQALGTLQSIQNLKARLILIEIGSKGMWNCGGCRSPLFTACGLKMRHSKTKLWDIYRFFRIRDLLGTLFPNGKKQFPNN